MARVRTILDEGTPEQISSLRSGEKKKGGRHGVRTTYEEVQEEKLKSKLSAAATPPTTIPPVAAEGKPKKGENLSLLNKDFRVVSKEEVQDGTVDLVLALDFPLAAYKNWEQRPKFTSENAKRANIKSQEARYGHGLLPGLGGGEDPKEDEIEQVDSTSRPISRDTSRQDQALGMAEHIPLKGLRRRRRKTSKNY
jgi:hypothetical protein